MKNSEVFLSNEDWINKYYLQMNNDNKDLDEDLLLFTEFTANQLNPFSNKDVILADKNYIEKNFNILDTDSGFEIVSKINLDYKYKISLSRTFEDIDKYEIIQTVSKYVEDEEVESFIYKKTANGDIVDYKNDIIRIYYNFQNNAFTIMYNNNIYMGASNECKNILLSRLIALNIELHKNIINKIDYNAQRRFTENVMKMFGVNYKSYNK